MNSQEIEAAQNRVQEWEEWVGEVEGRIRNRANAICGGLQAAVTAGVIPSSSGFLGVSRSILFGLARGTTYDETTLEVPAVVFTDYWSDGDKDNTYIPWEIVYISDEEIVEEIQKMIERQEKDKQEKAARKAQQEKEELERERAEYERLKEKFGEA